METKKTTADYKYFIYKPTGKKLPDPFYNRAYMDSKVDVSTGKFIESWESEYNDSTLPTFEDLDEQNLLEKVNELEIGEIRGVYDAAKAQAIAKEKFGINIPIEAFEHNIDAHNADFKSGYVTGEFYLFTPCRCNEISFDIERYAGIDYQKTYMA